jgi:hypothetical protein
MLFYMVRALPLICIFWTGCLPERLDARRDMEGLPLQVLMKKIGASLEQFSPLKSSEGRIINETQKLWHYLQVSSTTRLVFIRSQYTFLSKVRETIVARFDHPLGTIDVTAVDDDVKEKNGVDRGHIKFTAEVENPSPGTARGEIYPFIRTLNGETFPPSMQMTLPPGFVFPTGSNMDHRKKYIKDEKSIEIYQQIIIELFDVGMREVVLPESWKFLF